MRGHAGAAAGAQVAETLLLALAPATPALRRACLPGATAVASELHTRYRRGLRVLGSSLSARNRALRALPRNKWEFGAGSLETVAFV